MKFQELKRLQLLFFVFTVVLEIIVPYVISFSSKDLLYSLLFYPLYISTFYFFYYCVFRYQYFSGNFYRVWVNAIAGVFGFYFIYYFLFHYVLAKYIDPGNPFYETMSIKSKQFLVYTGMKLFTYTVFAYFFWTFEKLLMTQREKAALNELKLQVEYNYLKSQINPHFLYNTLSFFYSRMLKQDKQAANGIAALSGIMRYSLESGDNDGKVKLEQEVEQIENYILLQQLRFDQQLHIKFEYNMPLPDVLVLPHIFITLVENVFKHGVTDDPAHPLTILLQANPHQLSFSLQNKKSNKEKDRAPGGIGLHNLHERLKLVYPGKHEFDVRDTAEEYSTNLKISI